MTSLVRGRALTTALAVLLLLAATVAATPLKCELDGALCPMKMCCETSACVAGVCIPFPEASDKAEASAKELDLKPEREESAEPEESTEVVDDDSRTFVDDTLRTVEYESEESDVTEDSMELEESTASEENAEPEEEDAEPEEENAEPEKYDTARLAWRLRALMSGLLQLDGVRAPAPELARAESVRILSNNDGSMEASGKPDESLELDESLESEDSTDPDDFMESEDNIDPDDSMESEDNMEPEESAEPMY
jgi:hypothetical protein